MIKKICIYEITDNVFEMKYLFQKCFEETEMEKLESLYIHGLTPELMDKNILKKHFSKFAEVTHIYLSSKINSCTIHFKTHVSILRNLF